MRRLTARLLRRLSPRRLAEERGASAVMTVLLLPSLLACGAIAVDVASFYSDRTQLQNAADAAALAVAADCARGSCGGTAATAAALRDANAGSARDATLRDPVVSVGSQRVEVTMSADANRPRARPVRHPRERHQPGHLGADLGRHREVPADHQLVRVRRPDAA
jgi:Flp pilus assembly protein TadG